MEPSIVYNHSFYVYIFFVLSMLVCMALPYILGVFWFCDVRNRHFLSFFLIGAEVFFWTLFSAITMVSHMDFFPFIFTLRMSMVVIVPFGFTWFLLNFVHSPLKTPIVKKILTIVPAIAVLFLWTNPFHHIFVSDYHYPIPTKAVIFWIQFFTGLFCVAVAFVSYIRYWIQKARKNILLILAGLGMVLFYLTFVLYMTGNMPIGYDISPIVFFLSFLLFMFSAYRSKLLEIKTNLMASTINASDNIIVIFNEKGDILDINQAARVTFADTPLTSEDVSMESLFDFLGGIVTSSQPVNLLTSIKEDMVDIKGECTIKMSEGKEHIFTVSGRIANETLGKGKRAEYIMIFTDITSYREMLNVINIKSIQMEELAIEAEAANHAKSLFLANMSHELRTPMNSIIGFSELAQEFAILTQVREYLQNITGSAKKLLHMMGDVLDISEIESGQMVLEKMPFDLYNIFQRCRAEVQEEADAKGLELHVYVEPTTGRKLLGDKVRLQQVLIHLLSNAVKFTETGSVRISSLIAKDEDKYVTIYFEVKDTGIGISEDQIEDIYNPFMQEDSGAMKKYGGLGLGLPVSKNIIELMGGELEVKSRKGVGTTFGFELRFETTVAEEDISENISEIEQIEMPHFYGLVLICEDNNLNQQVITEHLTRVGLASIIAENGKIGLEILREHMQEGQRPFDLILMDMFMPVMDGAEAIQNIYEMGVNIPVIIMTANAMTDEIEKLRKFGVNDYVRKPFTTQDLWHSLLRHLKPISLTQISAGTQEQEDDTLEKQLKVKFAKNNQEKYREIQEAITSGDMAVAHRLVHTLKGNAGLIGQSRLQSISQEMETILYNKAMPEDSQMESLHKELDHVLIQLQPLLEEEMAVEPARSLSPEEVKEVFEKLEPLLKARNPESVTLLKEVQAIPGAEELAGQLEKYNLKQAAKILAILKEGI